MGRIPTKTETDQKPVTAAARNPSQAVRLRLSVLIVNYRDWPATERLVGQLWQADLVNGKRAEIVIVDNDSPPDSATFRLQQRPGVTICFRPRNEGFARAVNFGVERSRGDWLLLLNPDVEARSNFLDGVLTMLDRVAPDDGLIGLRLQNPDGTTQPSVGLTPTIWSTLFGMFRAREQRKCHVLQGKHPCRVAWVTGCGMLIRRSCFEMIGGFDSDFFLYYEDLDLAMRARAAQWRVLWTPTPSIVHRHPLHSRAVPPRLRLLTRQALLTYSRKHWSVIATTGLAGIILIESFVRSWRHRRDKESLATFRHLRRLAWEFLIGRSRNGYQRAWEIAQGGRRDVRMA
jgi:GT2 family glycosyltransferase